MQHAADSTEKHSLVRARGGGRETGSTSHLRPAVTPRVDVFDFQRRFVEVLRQGHITQSTQLRAPIAPGSWYRVTDAAKHHFLCDRVELKMTSGRQEREAVPDLTLDVPPTSSEECPESPIEPKLLAVQADEIENRADRLPVSTPQSSSKLLEEQCRTVRWPQQQQRVNGGDVYTPLEKIDREKKPHPPPPKKTKRSLPFPPPPAPPHPHG